MVSRDDPQRPFLGSMGIYLFKTKVLFDLLENTTLDDFGGNVIPAALDSHKVYGYDFDDYWEDIGTIRSFYDTNIALCNPDTKFNFYDPDRPIYTNPRFLPGSIIDHSTLENVLLAEGCCIKHADIHHSVVGLRSQISGRSTDHQQRIDGRGLLPDQLGQQCAAHRHRQWLPDSRGNYR